MTFGLTEHGYTLKNTLLRSTLIQFLFPFRTCVTVDPTEREEHVFEGEVVVAMNSHKELCAVHCTGGMLLQKAQVIKFRIKFLSRS